MEQNGGSRQKTAERSNDIVNQIRHVMERFNSRFTFNNARCVERYVEGETAILCHFLIEGFDVEFVARFQGKQLIRRV